MLNDVISVSGQSVEMENRICAGGCGMSFRVMKSSGQKIARNDCDLICKHLVPSYNEMCAKLKEEQRQEKRREAQRRLNLEKKYKCAVFECFDMMNEELREMRPHIVKKSISVCYLRTDSQEKKNFFKGMSTSNFAKALGVEPRIFRGWVKGFRDVVSPLGLDIMFITRLEFDACVRVSQRLKGRSVSRDELFHEFLRMKEKMQK